MMDWTRWFSLVWLLACLILLLLSSAKAQNITDSDECEFPSDWHGSYFKSGQRERENFIIKSEVFGAEGKCFRKVKEDKYIIFNRQERCYRCLKVWKRHENYFVYKLGSCKNRQGKTTDNCNIIPESPFSELLKIDGPNTACPFTGEFTFTYKEGRKECDEPESYINQCVDSSQMKLRFGVCPDSVQTEANGNMFYQTFISLEGDPIETLTCKAVWINNLDENESYMVGTLDYRYKRTAEERVRCFLVKQTKRGIQVAQSENSSCWSNLHSSIAGYRTLKLDRVERKVLPGCLYPVWARQMKELLSFSLSSIYHFSEDGFLLSLSNYSVITNSSYELSRTECVNIVEESEDYIKLVAQTNAGCDRKYKCLRMFKRSEDIMEIQEGSPTGYKDAACSFANFDEKWIIYTTLIRKGVEKVVCPINGLHNVTELYLRGKSEQCDNQGFTTVNIRCGDSEEMIQFYQECPDEEKPLRMKIGPKSNYICLGGWQTEISFQDLPLSTRGMYIDSYESQTTETEESDLFVADEGSGLPPISGVNITLGFLIAAQELSPEKRICFMYTKNKENSYYSWTVDKTACLRNIRPGIDGRQRFNTTVLETCTATTCSSWRVIYLAVMFIHLYFSTST